MAFTAAYYYSQLRFGLTLRLPEASNERLMAGIAQTPQQYRVLIPWLVTGLLRMQSLFWHAPQASSVDLFQAAELLSIFLLLLAFRHFTCLFTDQNNVGTLLSFAIFLALPFHHVIPVTPIIPSGHLRHFVAIYPWDTPSILLFTVGLILIYKRAWKSYYPLFVIATLNRETTWLLTLTFLVTSLGGGSFRSIALHCSIQLVIWVAIKYILFQLYIDNVDIANSSVPGQPSITRMFSAVRVDPRWLLGNIRHYPFLLSFYSYLWVPVLALMRFINSAFLRRALIVPVILGGLAAYVGTMGELRVLQEAIPVVVVAFVVVLERLFTLEPVTAIQS